MPLIFTRLSTAFGHKNDNYPIEYKKKRAIIHGMTTGTKSNRPSLSEQVKRGFKKNER